MTHGGGTVAGESPDKSEQRKSSGETTREERDPRLAVFRQASPGRGTASASAQGSAPAQGDAPARGGDSGHDAPPSDDAAERPAPLDQPTAVFKAPAVDDAGERDAAPEGNDARLRAAVAAWVATADEPDAEEPDAAEPDAAEAAEGAQAPAEAEEPGAGRAPAETDGTAGEEAPAAPDAASEVDAPADDLTDGADAGVASEGDASTETEEPAGSAPKPAEVEKASKSQTVEESDEPDESGEPDESAESDGDSSDDAPSGDAAVGEDGNARKASPAPASISSDSAEAKSEDAPTEPADRAVDQPTTVFKALRRPVVDQPTTALKVPPLPKPKAEPAGEPKAEPKAEPAADPEPETDAERTSTFVPLRRDDVRPTPSTPPSRPTPPSGSTPPAAPESREPEPQPAAAQALPSAQAPASLGETERTRQQPMPPLPPLDLLAELTNTPPPPETPVRTVVRRVKIWTPLVLLLLIVFAVVQLVRPLPEPSLTLSAKETYTFEGGPLELPWPAEGQGAAEVVGVGSLGTYGAQKPAPIASVAKTMTAYVILRDHPIKGKEVGPKITVDKKAEEESKAKSESTAPIKEGQQFTEKQMLQLLMIPSGNNAARLLARWDAGSEEAFVKKMNDAAKELGMTNSTYTDPSGLKASTVSTPLDQLKLGKAVMEYDVFREIVNMTQAEIPGIDGAIRNNNDRALMMDGVGGIKTGSSTPAGGNLLWSANAVVDGEVRLIVGIVMGAQDAPLLWQKLEKAIDYSIAVIPPAQEAVTSATVVKKGDVVGHVDDGLGGRTPVVATKDLKAVGWAGLDVKIEIAGKGGAIPHAAKAGTLVGQVSVGEGVGKVSAPVALQKDLEEPGFGAKLTRLG
ncbi:serine hydrolase [Streptomyces sp. NPDC096176]|uniref:D-alanyl-D-alanine carboxypeptidase n=1 Tax=Streptomyces sp. NPDC096176 TaxID=3366079 RepID=UPI0038274746